MNLHLALKRFGGRPDPPDYAGLLWLQWCLKLKHFKPNPFQRLSVCVSSKERSLWVRFVFIYIQTPGCMAVRKNIITLWKENIGNIAFFVIALVLHTDTKRATREHQLFASVNHIDQRIFSSRHKTPLEKIQEGAKRSESLQERENVTMMGVQSGFDWSSPSWKLNVT